MAATHFPRLCRQCFLNALSVLLLWLLGTASDAQVQQWQCRFDSSTDYPAGWRYDTGDFGIDTDGRLRLNGPENSRASTSAVATSIPYGRHMIWRGELCLDFKPTRYNHASVLLYCYGQTGDISHYVALSFGAEDERIRLITADAKPPQNGGELSLTETGRLIVADNMEMYAEGKYGFEVHFSAGKGWTLLLRSDLYPEKKPYSYESDFACASSAVRGGLALVCRYTKTRRTHIAFDNLEVQTSDKAFDEPEDPDTPEEEPLTLPEVRITELMAKPGKGNAEYIELFNTSDKPIPLRRLAFALAAGEGAYRSFSSLKNPASVPAKSYIVLTTNKSALRQSFPNIDPNKIIEQPVLPRLADTGFTLLLLTNEEKPVGVDTAIYNLSAFPSKSKTKAGVSLELTELNTPGTIPANWHPSSAKLGGTPTEKNSPKEGSPGNEGKNPTTDAESDATLPKTLRGKMLSLRKLVSLTLTLMNDKENRCAASIFTLTGERKQHYRGDRILPLFKRIASEKDINLIELFGELTRQTDYIIVVFITGPEIGQRRYPACFRVLR